ncbi:hypothetical protein, partial [Robertmurraya sp.]|uniref:hypothetical protein n=1 Tax=Robertmurraya sp. TaxID=2837525 RepID=UPI0037044D9D
MKILRDKIILLVLLTSLSLAFIIATRGKLIIDLQQAGAGNKSQIHLSKNLIINNEYFINPERSSVGVASTFYVSDTCFSLNNLSIKIHQGTERLNELPLLKTQIIDL